MQLQCRSPVPYGELGELRPDTTTFPTASRAHLRLSAPEIGAALRELGEHLEQELRGDRTGIRAARVAGDSPLRRGNFARALRTVAPRVRRLPCTASPPPAVAGQRCVMCARRRAKEHTYRAGNAAPCPGRPLQRPGNPGVRSSGRSVTNRFAWRNLNRR